MGGLLYQMFSSITLVSLGLYHIISSIRNYLRSPHSFIAKPLHPFPFLNNKFKHLHLYLIISSLFIAFLHQTLISSDSDPLLKGHTPVHLFTSLQSSALLFLFLLVAFAFLLSESTSLLPLPSDLFFAVAASLFFLQLTVSYSAASVQTSDLQARCDFWSGRVAGLSSILCFVLACQPRLFVADVGLGGSICLQGLWALQTGLSLYVETFIPDGCHRLLDVVSGVEGSTKCDLEESRLRGVAVLDLMFVIHVMFVVSVVFVAFAVIAKSFGIRRLGGGGGGSYEPLPTTAAAAADSGLVQLKALTGTQA